MPTIAALTDQQETGAGPLVCPWGFAVSSTDTLLSGTLFTLDTAPSGLGDRKLPENKQINTRGRPRAEAQREVWRWWQCSGDHLSH